MKKNIIYTSLYILLYVLLIVGFLIFLNSMRYENFKRECYNAYKYSEGIIYIGKKECLDTVKKNDKDLLVLDARSDKNPDMKVYDSYKISKEDVQREVIKQLFKHEEKKPSKWKRTENSLVNEWYAHNLLYSFGYKKERTKDVDFDNSDEVVYEKKLGINTLIKYYSK